MLRLLLFAVFLSAGTGNDTKEGVFTEYFKNDIITQGQYEKGSRQGHWEFYLSNQKKHFEGNFNDGLRNGAWKFYHPNGNLMMEAYFTDNVLNGKLSYFEKSGNPKAELHFSNGAFNGNSFWFANEESEAIKVSTIVGGRMIEKFHENGQVRSVCHEWAGKQNDTAFIFYADGSQKEMLVFYKNLLLGVGESFDNQKQLQSIGSFNNGDGELIRYYDDGKIKSRVYYKAGLKHGLAQYYFKNGQLQMAGKFSNGFKSGIWKYFHEKGGLSESKEFRNNVADNEFELEFSYTPNLDFLSSCEPSFPGGLKDYDRFLKKSWAEFEGLKGRSIWIHADVDEYGFLSNLTISPVNCTLNYSTDELIAKIGNLPRCSPAFLNGLPVKGELNELIEF